MATQSQIGSAIEVAMVLSVAMVVGASRTSEWDQRRYHFVSSPQKG